MTAELISESLPLLEALVRWCDRALVEEVRSAERSCTTHELASFHLPQLTRPDECRPPSSTEWMNGGSQPIALTAGWNVLERNFRSLIERGSLYLAGVNVTDRSNTKREPIPGVWAADLKFDFGRNALERRGTRYVGIRVAPTPFAPPPDDSPLSHPAKQAPFGVEDIADRGDDVILALLEEHAKRVVENASAKLIAPGRISLVPIILRKMRYRAERGELEPTLSGEMTRLASWIGSKVPSHQVPRAKSLANVLRLEYAACKAQSKGMKA